MVAMVRFSISMEIYTAACALWYPNLILVKIYLIMVVMILSRE